MIVGIVGGGVVGQATARTWLEHCREVRVYDILPERRTHDLPTTLCANVVFVCLPTPQNPDGTCDTSALDEFFCFRGYNRETQVGMAQGCYAIRSTVPVGYTKRLVQTYSLANVVHNPEFLTARCAHTDSQVPARNILGFTRETQRAASVVPGGHQLTDMYARRFPGVQLFRVDSNTSELCKLAQNAFFATKVAFFNELYSLTEKIGVNYTKLRELLLSDGRVGPSHTLVPGPDGQRGFGGTCLPKDLASYVAHMHEHDLPAWVAQGAIHRNEEDRPHGT